MRSFIDEIIDFETVFSRAFMKDGKRVGDRRIVNTLQIPFRWICKIDAYFNDDALDLRAGLKIRAKSASGVFITSNVILTCAHALTKVKSNGNVERANRVEIIPGFDSNRSHQPFGSYSSNDFHLPVGFILENTYATKANISDKMARSRKFDYALIKLQGNIGNKRWWWVKWVDQAAAAAPNFPCLK